MPNRHRLRGRFFCVLMTLLFAGSALASGPTLCDIRDVVYGADGNPAHGKVLILWPAFTTADGQPIAAGQTTVELGPNGEFAAGLAPNSGAMPEGTYYRVTYKLSDAVAGKNVVDPGKFTDGLSKVIDGVVQCLNASVWAQKKQ